MLQWSTAGKGKRFCLIVHHTDSEREYAYDKESHVGRLDKALTEAKANEWIVVGAHFDNAVGNRMDGEGAVAAHRVCDTGRAIT